MHYQLVNARKERFVGKRVEFVRCAGDDPNPLTPGDQGLVVGVGDAGTLAVEWDSGRRLGVLVEDEVRMLHER